MKDLFPGYYLPTEEDFEEIWAQCLFVLDANVLLNLYRYPSAAQADLFRLLEAVSPRLWVPFYAALEYQRNRVREIASQKNRFSEVNGILDSIKRDLERGIGSLQLGKRHSLIDPEPLLRQVDQVFSEFKSSLAVLEEAQPNVYDHDAIRERLDQLLDGKIGSPHETQVQLDDIYSEGKKRYQLRVPPGYQDSDKATADDSSFWYGGLVYRREYGDLIIWKQIIEAAKQKDVSYVVFVTDDKKDDWWWSVRAKGDKVLGPRPELVEEISREAGVIAFHMYTTERFLTFGRQYLDVDVSDESIGQVRDVISVQFEKRREDFRRRNLREWEALLREIFPSSIPAHRIWTTNEEIIRVLNKVASWSYMAHTFFPGGGGMDITEVRESAEPGCIELETDGSCYIVKPVELIFESFGDDYQWAYFRLETGGLKPSGVYDRIYADQRETLTELEPGIYVDIAHWEEGYYGYDDSGYERPLPSEARLVTRVFEGAFVTFAKASIYNTSNVTYDGRHNKMTSEQFRQYIQLSIASLDQTC